MGWARCHRAASCAMAVTTLGQDLERLLNTRLFLSLQMDQALRVTIVSHPRRRSLETLSQQEQRHSWKKSTLEIK